MFDPPSDDEIVDAIQWLCGWQRFGDRLVRRLIAADTSADFRLRCMLGLLYKDYLSPTLQVEFVELFRAVPTVTRDFVELERRRAWDRRRHLVATWHQ